MPVLRLLRATKNNNILTRLRAEWDAELAASEDAPPIDVYEPMMAHADAIVATRDEDARYGIFAVAHCEDGCDTDGPPYEAFVHIGHKLPNTTDATLKVLWNLFAPRYQAGDLSPADMARIMTAIVSGAFELSKIAYAGSPDQNVSRQHDRSRVCDHGCGVPRNHRQFDFVCRPQQLAAYSSGMIEKERRMDTKGLEGDLYAAFLHAATQMGARIKGMSCFVRNWQAVKPLADAASSKSDKIALAKVA